MIVSSRFCERQVSRPIKSSVFWSGNKLLVDRLSDLLSACDVNDLLSGAGFISDTIKDCPGSFGLIYEDDKKVVCMVDLSRSWPIFYAGQGESFLVSDDGRELAKEMGANDVDRNALIEFCSSGYVHGSKTLLDGVFQLESGNMLVFDKKTHKNNVVEYYRFYPDFPERDNSYDDNLAGLTETLENVFDRLVDRLDGRKAVIPLSGGLDSKLILSMLVLRGYNNILTYSYGPKKSYEVNRARALANQLGVPWQYIPFSRKKYYSGFRSPDRKKYWEFSDSLTSVPVMNDYFSLEFLLHEGLLSDDSVIINGQTGDFISGGHIPLEFVYGRPSKDKFTQQVFSKHVALWKKGVTDNIQKHGVSLGDFGSIVCSFGEPENTVQLCAEYEMWEWKERQSKLVVNGQRAYEFFGLSWELPFWDPELVMFFEKVPYQYRYDQSLFRDCLKVNNYLGLFENPVSENRRWPGMTRYLSLGALIIEKLLSIEKTAFSKYLSYFGHYSDQYVFYGFRDFIRVVGKAHVPPQARGVIALGVDRWIHENLTSRDGITALKNI